MTRSRPLPVIARRVGATLAALLVCSPIALGAPGSDDLRSRQDALSAQDASLLRELGAAERSLSAARARLDQARTRQRTALDGFERRVTALYVMPTPSPLLELFAGGDLDGAQAGLDLLEALSGRDRELVRSYQESARALRSAEASVRRDKDRLVRARRQLGVQRQLVRGELATTIRRERAVAQQERAAGAPVLTTGGGLQISAPFGLPVASAPTAPDAISPARGLPTALLEGRGLPGAAPVDAQTGAPVDAEPVAPSPPVTRALPGLGVVGPATGIPREGSLPTFTAVASWYGPGFTREHLASGEPYDPAAYSAASRTLRLGTLLRIGYGGRVVTVRVNDRGPYVPGRDLELSQAAAAALGLPGVGTVTAQILPAYAGPLTRS